MIIILDQISKKYNKDWIFKKVCLEFKKGRSYAITGPNGSGKSTLLQIIAGNILPTKGCVSYRENQTNHEPDKFFEHISLAAPYLELPEEFALKEFLKFHFSFKKLSPQVKPHELPDLFNLKEAEDKYIKNFSTGMKQRLKLGIALVADTPAILLDEPATNLDRAGLEWYRNEIKARKAQKILVISSNREEEYDFCDEAIDVLKYK